MTFKDRLKTAMKEAGLTQASLAKEAGMAQSMIWKLVSGKANGTSKIVDISKALRVRPEWLSEGSGPMRESESSSNQMPFNSLFPVEIYNINEKTDQILMVPDLVKGGDCKAFLLTEDTGCVEAPKGTYIVVDSKEVAGNNDLVYAEVNGVRSVYRFIRGGENDFLSVDDSRIPLIPTKSSEILGVVVFLLRGLKRG